MPEPGAVSRRRTISRRTREIHPGPRTRLLEIWMLFDAPVIGAAGLIASAQFRIGHWITGAVLLLLGGLLAGIDIARLRTIHRMRRLAMRGRIDRATITGTRLVRLSRAMRADGLSPSGGWPLVCAAEIAYVYVDQDGVSQSHRFVVSRSARDTYREGQTIEVFASRHDQGFVVPSLVLRWYFRLSSRVIGVASDDPGPDFLHDIVPTAPPLPGSEHVELDDDSNETSRPLGE